MFGALLALVLAYLAFAVPAALVVGLVYWFTGEMDLREHGSPVAPKVALVALVVALLLSGFGAKGCVMGCAPNYSDGTRVGIVTKMTRKGLVWKSWDGTIAMGASSPAGKDNTLQPVQFDFSVADPAVVQTLQNKLTTGERVTVHYHEWINSPIQYGHDYIITEAR